MRIVFRSTYRPARAERAHFSTVHRLPVPTHNQCSPASSGLQVHAEPAMPSQSMQGGSDAHAPRPLAAAGQRGMAASASLHVHVVAVQVHGAAALSQARSSAKRKSRMRAQWLASGQSQPLTKEHPHMLRPPPPFHEQVAALHVSPYGIVCPK